MSSKCLFTPHRYQRIAMEKILDKKGVALFMDMGLGKTVTTLTAISELMFDHFEIGRVLVIAPLRVAEDTWTRECDKWSHLSHFKISRVLGTVKQRREALDQDAHIYVINRENVPWLVEEIFPEWPFDMIIIDELSSFKSSSSKRFKALKKVLRYTKRIVGLTGTPAPNGLMDLWSQIYLIDQGERLGTTLTAYRTRFFYPSRSSGYVVYEWSPHRGAEDIIYGSIKDICVSMSAEDWLAMPERIDNIVPVTLPDHIMDNYKEMKRHLVLSLSEDTSVVASNAAVLTNKLLQFANGAVYDERGEVQVIHELKVRALEDILEASNNNPVLIFYNFKHDLQRIEHLGKVLRSEKDISRWNKGEIPVLIAHPASAGHGLNLQHGGNTVVWFGLPWSLELYQQANARLHRQGQTKSVIVHHIITENTIDKKVLDALRSKELDQNQLLEAVKGELYESV